LVAIDTLGVANTVAKGTTLSYVVRLWQSGAATTPVASATFKLTADTAEKFVTATAGIYDILRPGTVTSDNGLFAQMVVSDIPLGVYPYKIVKSYPDGRVVTIEDTAEVTGLDANQIAVFGASTKANNTKFNDNFKIDENNTEFKKGVFNYEFTFNGITRKYVINILEQPKLDVSNISVGTTNSQLFNTSFTLKPADYATALNDVKLTFLAKNLFSATHITVTASFTDGDAADDGAFAISPDLVLSGGGPAPVALKDLTSLLVGTLTETHTTLNKVVFTVTFWRNVNFSVNSTRYIQVGEVQTVTLGYLEPLA
jgi:hypothetical protein